MEDQEYNIVVNRPIGEVFAYLDDVESESQWQPNLREAEKTPPGPSTVGTTKRYVSQFLGKRIENTYEVIEMGPGWRVVYRTTPDSSIEATSEVRCEPEGDGTRVTMVVTARPGGALRLVPKKLIEKASREEMAESLERLKALLEA